MVCARLNEKEIDRMENLLNTDTTGVQDVVVIDRTTWEDTNNELDDVNNENDRLKSRVAELENELIEMSQCAYCR